METMNMNIDTLLEAAIFLEKRSGSQGWTTSKARAKTASFHPYAKAPGKAPASSEEPNGFEGDSGDLPGELDYSPGEDGKERRRAGGAGTREVHNKLEKNRRAHLKECFEQLKMQIPTLDDKRTSNLSILRCSLRYIQMLKRKEKELEVEMQFVAKEKLRSQDRIVCLKHELNAMNIDIDVSALVSAAAACKEEEEDTCSDSTATADNESPIVSEAEGDDVEEDDDTKATIKQECDTEVDRKPHVPVKATLPAIQTPPMAVSLAVPKQMAVNASAPIVIASAPHNQTLAHAVLAIPSARALSSVSKVMPAQNQSIMALQAGASTMSLSPGLMAGPVLSPVPSPGHMLANASAPAAEPQTATATFKTPVAQILQQTLAQRALAQHLQQHQARLQQQQPPPQQQQLQQQPQPQQQPNTPQGAKVFTVQGNTLRHNLPALTQLRQAVTMNHLVPSLLAPGTSILTAPGSLTPAQMGTIAAVGKVPEAASSAAIACASSSAAPFTTTTNTVSATQAMSPAVTFTTMKPFLTPQQLPAHIMSFSGTQMSAIGQLITQGVQRNPGAVQQQPRAVGPAPAPGDTVTGGTVTGLTPITSGTMVTLASNTAQQQQQQQQQHSVMTSLTHMAPAGAQLVAPLSMMTSQAGLSATALSQAQLSLVNSPILRSLGHIPIQLQQPFGLGQLVKPVVMVSMPSGVTTTSQPTSVPVQLPVTHT